VGVALIALASDDAVLDSWGALVDVATWRGQSTLWGEVRLEAGAVLTSADTRVCASVPCGMRNVTGCVDLLHHLDDERRDFLHRSVPCDA
jgi:hypothetical protein